MKQVPSDYVVTDFTVLGQGYATKSGGVIDSSTLFSNSDKLAITHNGEAYLLRVTRSGKLILTK